MFLQGDKLNIFAKFSSLHTKVLDMLVVVMTTDAWMDCKYAKYLFELDIL